MSAAINGRSEMYTNALNSASASLSGVRDNKPLGRGIHICVLEQISENAYGKFLRYFAFLVMMVHMWIFEYLNFDQIIHFTMKDYSCESQIANSV